MKIIIDSDKVATKSGTAKGTGKPYSMRSQEGYIDKGERYPAKMRFLLDGNDPPYPPGEYSIDFAESTYLDGFDQLTLSASLKLVPIKASK